MIRSNSKTILSSKFGSKNDYQGTGSRFLNLLIDPRRDSFSLLDSPTSPKVTKKLIASFITLMETT
jgi:hypothetical protein